VVANLDGSPQAYQRLERTIVEASQQFGTARNFAAPVHVDRLGVDASWFPDLRQVMTTDNRRLITVGVIWPHAPARRLRALAIAVARAYLAGGSER
jgi:hypothetical protein